jgi:NAD-dependent DNA ligase
MMEIDEEDLKDAVGDTNNLATCLEGLTIVLSGVFESISREKLEEFIRDH